MRINTELPNYVPCGVIILILFGEMVFAAPGTVTNLNALQGEQVYLTWTAPGRTDYTDPITGGQWQIAYSSDSAATPQTTQTVWVSTMDCVPGVTRSLTLTGFIPRTTYYFWIRTADEASTWSQWSASSSAIAGTFYQWQSLTGIGNSDMGNQSVAVGDYDADGDLDMVITGYITSGQRKTIVYRNQSGLFTNVQELTVVGESSVAWGDYDNDGDLDLALTGYGVNRVFEIWRNDNGTFNQTYKTTSHGTYRGGVAWGDYNNDGRLDVITCGDSEAGTISRLYRNDVTTFTYVQYLSSVSLSAVAWADYDNDGYIDLVLGGMLPSIQPIIKIYKNNNGTLTDTLTIPSAISYCSFSWGDYNNDGKLDLGSDGYTGSITTTTIYANNISTFIGMQSLAGVYKGGTAWADYDNNGFLDFIVTGNPVTGAAPTVEGTTKIYGNSSGSLSLTESLRGFRTASAAWGDFDNDGDLDLVICGSCTVVNGGRTTYVYKNLNNEYGITNTQPSSPATFNTEYTNGKLYLSWGNGNDTETPVGGLYYDIRVGTNSGGQNAVSAARGTPLLGHNVRPKISDSTLGIMHVPQIYNTTYYWSVKTVDTGLKRSNWSTEQLYYLVEDSPSQITDLTVSKSTSTHGCIDLAWTAPGDDGIVGTVTAYVLRYTTYSLVSVSGSSATWWSNATDAINEPVPSVYGTRQSMSVTGLTAGVTYYFNLRVYDKAGLYSDYSNFSSTIAAGATKLQCLLPGESSAIASVTGKTGPVNNQIAGVSFGITVNVVDDIWRVVEFTNLVATVTTSDRFDTNISTFTLLNGTTIVSLTMITAGTQTVTVSDIDGVTPDLGTVTGSTVTISANTPIKLQILCPGETVVSGSSTGKIGSPSTRTAGTSFTVTANLTDNYWNITSSDTPVIRVISTDNFDTEPSSVTLLNGSTTFSFTLVTASTWTHLTVEDMDSLVPVYELQFSTLTIVNALPAKLQLLLPGETAVPGSVTGKTGAPSAQTAGFGFNVTVRACDEYWNVVDTNSFVSVTTDDTYDWQPSATPLINGVREYVAIPITAGYTIIKATAAAYTGLVQSTQTVQIVPYNAIKLQLLVPDDVYVAAHSVGKTGTIVEQGVGTAFTVTINCVDMFWNIVSTANPPVWLQTSDPYDTEPINRQLQDGTTTFEVVFVSTGNWTITVATTSAATYGYIAYTSSAIPLIAPSEITNLSSVIGNNEGEVVLAWTSPGEDGTIGQLLNAKFKIQYSTDSSSAASDSTSTQIQISTSGLVTGNWCSYTVTGLTGGTTYYFRIKTRDHISNWSDLSNETSAWAQVDLIFPSAVTDLSAEPGTIEGKINLVWTAPGDDATSGTLVAGSKYKVQSSTFSDVAWSKDSAQIEISTSGVSPLTPARYTLTALSPGVTYYFKIWTSDESQNWSLISNLASTWAQWDVTTPSVVTDFFADRNDCIENMIHLTWTTPGDDGLTGTLQTGSKFKIQLSTFSEVTWSRDSAQIEISTANCYPSSVISHTTSLAAGVTYYLKIWTSDERGNWSLDSNLASAWAQVDITSPSAVTDLMADGRWETVDGSIKLTWTSPGDDGTIGQLVLGSKFKVQYSISDLGPWTSDLGQIEISTGALVSGHRCSYQVTNLTQWTTYYFRLWTGDERGNYSTISNYGSSYPCDVSSPTANILVPQNNMFYVALPTVSGTAADNLSGVKSVETIITRNSDNYYWSGSSWTSNLNWLLVNGTTSWYYNSLPAWVDGISYQVNYRVTDSTANYQTGPLAYTFIIDTTPPTANFTFPQNLVYYSSMNVVSGTAADIALGIVDSVEVAVQDKDTSLYWSGTTFNSTLSWFTVNGTSTWSLDCNTIVWIDGHTYWLYCRAKDKANNVLSFPLLNSVTFYFDTSGPVGKIIYPPPQFNVLSTVSGTANDNFFAINKVELSVGTTVSGQNKYWDGNNWVDTPVYLLCSGTTNWYFNPVTNSWPEGIYGLKTRAQDYTGNYGAVSEEYLVVYDTIPPQSTILNPLDKVYYQEMFIVSGTARDNLSGISQTELRITNADTTQYYTGSAWTNSSNWIIVGTTNNWIYDLTVITWSTGTYRLNSRVLDKSTNYETSFSTTTFYLVLPATKFNLVASTTTAVAGENFNFTVTAADVSLARAKGYRGKIYLVTDDTNSVVTPEYQYLISDLGEHSFDTVLKTAGTHYFQVTDASNPNIKGRIDSFTVIPNSATQIQVTGLPDSVLPGIVYSFKVRLLDNYQNVVYYSTDTIEFLSDDNELVFVSSYSFVNSDLGEHSFNYIIFNTTGTRYFEVRNKFRPEVYKRVTVYVNNTAYVSGKVTQYSTGLPISGIRVSAIQQNSVVQYTFTGIDGKYVIYDLPVGTYTIKTSWETNDIISSVYCETKIGKQNLDFTLEINYDLAKVSGKISMLRHWQGASQVSAAPYRSAISDAGAWVEFYQHGEKVLQINTDEQGEFNVSNLLPAKYTIKAFNGISYSLPQKIELTEGEFKQINFSFPLNLQNCYAYPNPVKGNNQDMIFRYQCDNPDHQIELKIFNISGEIVYNISRLAGELVTADPKIYKYNWNLTNISGDKVASGIYIYNLNIKSQNNNETVTVKKKVAVIR